MKTSLPSGRRLGALVVLLLIAVAVASHWDSATAAISPPSDLQPQVNPAVIPVVRFSLRNDVSPPLASLPVLPAEEQKLRAVPLNALPGRQTPAGSDLQATGPDPVWQAQAGPSDMPAPILNFEGIGNVDGVLPPDPVGDVGPSHYVQMVNLSFAIWDKTGRLLYGPAPISTLWSGFGGACASGNDGDPIVLYDHLADRWLISQMRWPNSVYSGPFYECIAVSATNDPLAAWYRYEFLFSNTKLNDYPKLAVWPDAYYMTANQFTAGSLDWAGQGVVALERERMLNGQAARMIYLDLYPVDPNLGGMLPADLDGRNQPPDGAPAYFAQIDNNAWGYSQDQLELWQFQVDWSNPASSTFSNVGRLATAQFNSLCDNTRSCIPQPFVSPIPGLDAIADRLMYRLQYRNFGSYQTLVVNHTVDAGSGRAGIRWYELRGGAAGWSIYQQGTYAPGSEHRWMGSAALDAVGNLALGYSVSSRTVYPSIRYAGRLAGDPLNTLPQAEASLATGAGSQTHDSSRWGDYSAMAVDPVDDCTFWYTQEYYATTSAANWQTRIGSFRFPSCTSGPAGAVAGRVVDAVDRSPIAGARVALGYLTTLSDAAGYYQVQHVPVGVYTVTASIYGYAPGAAVNVAVQEDMTATVDFDLEPLPTVTVQGVVNDGSGQWWPLYARIDISDYPFGPIFTDPATGRYSVTLLQGASPTLSIQALSSGYQPMTRTLPVLVDNATHDFSLAVDAATCNALGYRRSYDYFEDFEQSNGGYSVVDVSDSSWEYGAPAATPGPGSAHSGAMVWATNLAGNYNNYEDSSLVSPAIDLSAYQGQQFLLSWWQWLQTESCCDVAKVWVSRDDGAAWTQIWTGQGFVDSQWTEHSTVLDSSYAVSGFRLRFSLYADGSVTYPGYYVDDIAIQAIDVGYSSDFEASDGGFSVANVHNTSWAWGNPTSGPGSAHSGVNAWATNLAGDYGNSEQGSIVSPPIDLRSEGAQRLELSWWQWLVTESCCDPATIQVSRDGGATWAPVYSAAGVVDTSWTGRTIALDSSYATENFRVSFNLSTDGSVTYPGFYVDDVAVLAAPLNCDPVPGGLLVGNVHDGNTGAGIDGALVGVQDGPATETAATPEDEALADGFYTLFLPLGEQEVKAIYRGGYGPDVRTVSIQPNTARRQDFSLPAGWLTAAPSALAASVELGSSQSLQLTLSNRGALPAAFELSASDAGVSPLAPGGHLPYKRQRAASQAPWEVAPRAASLQAIAPKAWGAAAPLPGGSVYRAGGATCDGRSYYVLGGGSFSGAHAEAWRYDPDSDSWTQLADLPVALQNMQAVCIDGFIYLVGGYLPDSGAHSNDFQIYDTASDTWVRSTWPFARTPMLAAWDGKLFAFGGSPGPSDETWMYDPATGDWSGPLASMPLAATYGATAVVDDAIYVVGGASDGTVAAVQRYDPVADSWDASGPALPNGRMDPIVSWYGDYLYAASGGGNGDYWIAFDDTLVYRVTEWPAGSWQVQTARVPTPVVAAARACVNDRIHAAGGTDNYNEYDIHQYLDDGLSCHQGASNVPWLTMQPISGTVAAGAQTPISVTLDAGSSAVTQPGVYQAIVTISEDTPYVLNRAPVTMTVTAPATYGKLSGVVTSLGYCDAAPEPLPGAELLVESSLGLTWTLTSDVSGAYQLWLDQAGSPFTLSVSAAEHLPLIVPGVMVTGQVTTTQDVALSWERPCLQVEPASVDLRLGASYSATLPMTLTNDGAAPLVFAFGEKLGAPATARTALTDQSPGLAVIVGEDKALSAAAAAAGSLPAASGGPDAFGYVFRDSTEVGGPRYEWVEIAAPAGGSGTQITSLDGVDDGYFWSIALPFDFDFYYASYRQLAVASNGTVYFRDAYLGYGNQSIPSANSYGVNEFIASFWDDLIISPGSVYYLLESERAIVEYYQVRRLGDSDPLTFQVILYANGNIVLQFLDATSSSTGSRGGLATVGIQGSDTVGLQYSYDSPALSDGLAICFAYPGQSADCSLFEDVPWLATQPISGTLPAGSALPVAVAVDAALLSPGVYSATLVLLSNDPITPTLRIPVHVDVYLVEPVISDIRISNVRDNSLTISWVTDVRAPGLVRYGVNPDQVTRVAFDDRDRASLSELAGGGGGGSTPMFETHYVTLTGLRPGTTYYFEVVSGASTANNDGAYFQATTGPALGLPASDTVYGQVFQADGAAPAEGAVVFAAIQDGDGSGSSDRSALLSALVGRQGYWSLNLGNSRTVGLNSFFSYSASGDQLQLEVRAATAGTSCPAAVDTANDTPAPAIVLGASPCPDLHQLALQESWNLISLPVAPASPYTAGGVCQEIGRQGGALVEIDRWQAGGWDGHVCGLPANDFPVELGVGYFMNSAANSLWTIGGGPVTSPAPLALQSGWNAIGVPHSNAYTAASLCAEIVNQGVDALEVDRWVAGGWQGHVCGLPFGNFAIEIGQGYFVRAGSSGTVTPTLQTRHWALGSQQPAGPPLATPAQPAAVHALQVSNLRDSSFVVSWLTDEPATGYVRFGEAAALDGVAYDLRGANVVGRSHYVALSGLQPQTTYYFDVASGGGLDDNGGLHFQATTGPQATALPAPFTIYGQVFQPDGLTPAGGAIVTLLLVDGDRAGSQGQAQLMSALVDDHGYWQANLGNARQADGSAFLYSATGDQLLLLARGADGAVTTLAADTGGLRPARGLTLGSQGRLHLPVTPVR